MLRLPPRSTRTDTICPYTALFRSEICGWKRAASGHGYLCLKDDNAVLDGVMWKGVLQSLRFAREDGLEVIATGKLTTYPGRSKYQRDREKLEIAGAGAMMALLEEGGKSGRGGGGERGGREVERGGGGGK